MRRRSRHESFAVIHNDSRKFLMRKRKIGIGRSCSGENMTTDLEVGSCSVISRRHLELLHDSGRLYLRCLGKNGIFINGEFRENENVLYRLPKRSLLRFPSTNLELSILCLKSAARKPVGFRKKHLIPKIPRRFSIRPYPSDRRLNSNHCSSPQFQSSSTKDLDENSSSLDDDDFLRFPNAPSNSCNRRKQQLKSAPMCSLTSMERGFPVRVNSSIQNTSNVHAPKQLAYKTTDPGEGSALKPAQFSTFEADNSKLQSNNGYVWDMSLPISGSPMNLMTVDSSVGTFTISSAKPAYSFAQLIVQALASHSQRRLTLAGIYLFISQNYPYYRLNDKGWQNSIRHNLSLNKYFFKAPRNLDEPGKGCFWRMDPQFEDRLISQAYKLRRPRVNCETVPEVVTYLSLPSTFPTGHVTFSFLKPSAVVPSRYPTSKLIQPSCQPVRTFRPPLTTNGFSDHVAFSVTGSGGSLPTRGSLKYSDSVISSTGVSIELDGSGEGSTSNQNTSKIILNLPQKIFMLKNRIPG